MDTKKSHTFEQTLILLFWIAVVAMASELSSWRSRRFLNKDGCMRTPTEPLELMEEVRPWWGCLPFKLRYPSPSKMSSAIGLVRSDEYYVKTETSPYFCA